jgi:hypothetical protein
MKTKQTTNNKQQKTKTKTKKQINIIKKFNKIKLIIKFLL